MSHRSRNFVVAYILLVGLPLLGLAGVLRSGRSLTAPISVDGVWKIEADAGRLATLACDKSLSFSSSSVVISQSGKSLVLTFNNASKTVSSGVLEGKNLKASVVLERDPSSKSGCGDDQALTLTLTLTARVDPKSEPRSMTGLLSVNACTSCVPVEFHAVRQPRAAGGGAH
jgi:hypothetical protein